MANEPKQLRRTAGYAHRVAARGAWFVCQQGPQDPHVIHLGISKAKSTPWEGDRPEVTDHRPQATGHRYEKFSYFKPQVSGLKPRSSGLESPTRKDKNRN
jgi:hypothetical protein